MTVRLICNNVLQQINLPLFFVSLLATQFKYFVSIKWIWHFAYGKKTQKHTWTNTRDIITVFTRPTTSQRLLISQFCLHLHNCSLSLLQTLDTSSTITSRTGTLGKSCREVSGEGRHGSESGVEEAVPRVEEKGCSSGQVQRKMQVPRAGVRFIHTRELQNSPWL